MKFRFKTQFFSLILEYTQKSKLKDIFLAEGFGKSICWTSSETGQGTILLLRLVNISALEQHILLGQTFEII